MVDNNDTEMRTKQPAQTGEPTNAGSTPYNSSKQKIHNDTDTGPDQIIGSNADIDLPVDGQIINDAVLNGENNPDEMSGDFATGDSKEDNQSDSAKMNADKR